MKVRRVIHDAIDRTLLQKSNSAQEKTLAILFSDTRSFIAFSERHPAYDIVYIFIRYFLSCGESVLKNQGRIDKYIGDGLMAIFGLEGHAHPAQLTYVAALDMLSALEDFNEYRGTVYDEHFEIGIGIHYGPVVVGDLGHPAMTRFTAIGDTVNGAARVEAATKGNSARLVSEQVYAALPETGWAPHITPVKGKSPPLTLYAPPVGDIGIGSTES